MDYQAIQEILKYVSESDLAEVEVEQGDFKLKIKRHASEVYLQGPQGYPYAPGAAAQPAPPPQQPAPQPAAQQPPRQPAGQPAPGPSPSESGESSEEAGGENLYEMRSPMVGTFYRTPGPDQGPYVKVGDRVEKGQVLCIIEAMKLFNEIESEVAGKIVKIHAEHESPVEYDQPLFSIDLDA
jgi:acetyl-CoA carboxylase biotin carboxyl carrier protein